MKNLEKLLQNEIVKEHFKEIDDGWKHFSSMYLEENSSSYMKTNIKLNFINMTMKQMFGGDERDLLGIIGGDESLFEMIEGTDSMINTQLLNVEVCVYENNYNIGLITNMCWIGRPNATQLLTIKISEDSDEIINALEYLIMLIDIVGLKMGYVCYKKGDKEEKTFKSFGFKKSNLKTIDDNCYILLRKPKKHDFLK